MKPLASRTPKLNLLFVAALYIALVLGCVTPTCDVCRNYRGRYRLTYPAGDANAVEFADADSAGCLHYPRPDSTGNCGSVRATPAGSGFFFFFSPSAIDLQAPPPTFTITGGDLDTTYGMPLVEFRNESGYVISQTTAIAVASDGSQLEAYTPDLSWCYTGTYEVYISNANSDGGWNLLSSANVDLYGNDPPPPPDPCGYRHMWICY
jgi:hypothetical protein